MKLSLFFCVLLITFATWTNAERSRNERSSDDFLLEKLRRLLDYEVKRREYSLREREYESDDERAERQLRRKIQDFAWEPV